MRHIATIFALSLAVASSGIVGCSANIHDNTVKVNAAISIAAAADVDVNQITPGQQVPLKLSADGAMLVPPEQKVSSADAESAAYFKVFLDDTSSTELVATASTMVTVTIPPKTPEGHHQLICQLYKHDGTPTDQEQSLDINVKAMASATTSGNGTASGNASGTASGNTTTGMGSSSGSASGTATGNGSASGSASGTVMTSKDGG
jgi:hypothetical protein